MATTRNASALGLAGLGLSLAPRGEPDLRGEEPRGEREPLGDALGEREPLGEEARRLLCCPRDESGGDPPPRGDGLPTLFFTIS